MISLSPTDWDTWEKRSRTAFINQLSGAKPAFVLSSSDVDGNHNFAVFSNIIHLGATPPLLGILFRPDSVPRHSLSNVRATKKCGLNLISTDWLEQAHHTSARYPEAISEAEQADLKVVEKKGVPFIERSALQLRLRFVEECKMVNDTILVTFAIEEVFDLEQIIENQQLDLSKAQAVSVGGVNTYYPLSTPQRLSYAKAK